MPDQAFDRFERINVLLAGEREGLARRARTRRAPDAVDVVLGVLWQVVVEDVRHGLDVEPARRHVGGDQNAYLSGFELLEKLEALALVDVAGESAGGVTVRLAADPRVAPPSFGC